MTDDDLLVWVGVHVDCYSYLSIAITHGNQITLTRWRREFSNSVILIFSLFISISPPLLWLVVLLSFSTVSVVVLSTIFFPSGSLYRPTIYEEQESMIKLLDNWYTLYICICRDSPNTSFCLYNFKTTHMYKYIVLCLTMYITLVKSHMETAEMLILHLSLFVSGRHKYQILVTSIHIYIFAFWCMHDFRHF